MVNLWFAFVVGVAVGAWCACMCVDDGRNALVEARVQWAESMRKLNHKYHAVCEERAKLQFDLERISARLAAMSAMLKKRAKETHVAVVRSVEP